MNHHDPGQQKKHQRFTWTTQQMNDELSKGIVKTTKNLADSWEKMGLVKKHMPGDPWD